MYLVFDTDKGIQALYNNISTNVTSEINCVVILGMKNRLNMPSNK